jgi:F-type H+-transporting ATPase subunit a
MHNPLEQFQINRIGEPITLFGFDVSFSNSALFMVIAVLSSISLFLLGSRKREIVPGRFQSIVEMAYLFGANLVKENVGSEGRKYFPLIFSLFIFILFCNLLGMFPYSFTATSHIIVTFALALMIFITTTTIGFVKHGRHYFHLLLPSGIPGWLAPVIVLIELVSYFIRPISLSIRLAANMLAGHIILKVIAGFIVGMGAFGIIPFGFLFLMTGFEIFIAFLHAYIFTLLSCIYLNDAVNMH